MKPSQTRPWAAMDTVTSARRVGSEAVNPEATVASAESDYDNVSRVLSRGIVRAAVVWVSGPWYDPRTGSCCRGQTVTWQVTKTCRASYERYAVVEMASGGCGCMQAEA